LQAWTIRFPNELFDWIRVRAAERTILEKRNVSMNALVVETLAKAMKEDLKRKEKKRTATTG
jgi:tRNA isopentenyl-2-thiomethyl-A-37 hydroxylase MiaE